MGVTDRTALDAFLGEPRNVIVIGYRKDGRVPTTPNWFLWDGERFFISTTKTRAKYKVFSNDPRVQLVIDDSTGFRYAIVDGAVEIGDDIEAGLAFFEGIRAKHNRPLVSRDELRAEMVRDQRVLLMITPTNPPAEWPSVGL